MVSPFAAYENERRRRARLALRLPPDAPPELVDALIARANALGDRPAAVAEPSGNPFAAFLNRARGAFQRPEPPPDVNPQPAPYDYFAGWDETPGQTPIRQGSNPRTDVSIPALLGALAQAAVPESAIAGDLLGMGGAALGGRIAGETGKRILGTGGRMAGYTVGPGGAGRGIANISRTAALSGAGAAGLGEVGRAVGGPTGGTIGQLGGAVAGPVALRARGRPVAHATTGGS